MKYIFLLVGTEVPIAYTVESVAKKMKPVIEKELNVKLTLHKVRIDPDIKRIING